MNKPTNHSPDLDEKKILDDILRKMLSTPPKPHKKPEKTEQKKKTAE
ncbi:MAG: hypothetical protein ACHP7O_02475 [Burkholderiales bacterium]